MAKEFTKEHDQKWLNSGAPKKYPRHPITMENTPEETIRRMRSLPERAQKLRELIRALRKADAR
jgi:hypothetical protein